MMKIAGVLVDIPLEQNPNECSGHAVCEHGKKVPCAVALEAMCGMLQAALLWHKKFHKDSESIGHKFNNCNLCAADKLMQGNQVTVHFHVDNTMSSHIDT